MALLPEAGRLAVWRTFMREGLESCNFTKAQLRAAVDATDQWVEDNTAAYVASLPTAFRNNSSATQKTLIFAFVLWRRIGRLSTPEDG
jgi:hypothetical protein